MPSTRSTSPAIRTSIALRKPSIVPPLSSRDVGDSTSGTGESSLPGFGRTSQLDVDEAVIVGWLPLRPAELQPRTGRRWPVSREAHHRRSRSSGAAADAGAGVVGAAAVVGAGRAPAVATVGEVTGGVGSHSTPRFTTGWFAPNITSRGRTSSKMRRRPNVEPEPGSADVGAIIVPTSTPKNSSDRFLDDLHLGRTGVQGRTGDPRLGQVDAPLPRVGDRVPDNLDLDDVAAGIEWIELCAGRRDPSPQCPRARPREHRPNRRSHRRCLPLRADATS